MKISAIYSITNIQTNKFYIGSAVSIKNRWAEHKTRLRANNHHNSILQRAWNKYDEQSFEFKIIELVEDKSKLIEREQHWIDKTQCCDKEKGYNFCTQGKNNLGVKRSKETCNKISQALKGRTVSEERRIKISNTLKGRKRSLESIEKTASKLRGRKRKPQSKEWIEKMRVLSTGRKSSEETRVKLRNEAYKFWENRRPKFIGKPIIIVT